MADTGTHVPAIGKAHRHDVCECGHLRGAHRGDTGCLASLQQGGAGKITAHTASICSCDGMRPVGIRWVPPDEPEDRKLLKLGRSRAEHPLTL
jgi:hypothetical protein